MTCPIPMKEPHRWEAIASRDARADGRFVYAVESTGIYCRPSCPSRRPRRERVAYFESSAAAERAGFRACLRCRPDGASPAQKKAASVARACALLDEAEGGLNLRELAEAVGMSWSHFHRVFKQTLGVTPRQYAAERRAGKLRDELGAGVAVADAVYAAGYGSSSRVYERSREMLGMTPGQYRHGGAGIEIRYACADSALGKVLAAATEQGVCALMLGDDVETLHGQLAERFPKAQLREATEPLREWLDRVLACMTEPELGLDLPLDIRGTAFQRRVWDALQKIPLGQTRSYSEIAEALGAPGSARAVAGACAANPVALAVPCHRVVRSDGGLSGYRWGVARKRRLIDAEREAVKRVNRKD